MTLPVDFIVRLIGLDPRDNPCLWAEINTDKATIEQAFTIRGTGEAIPHSAVFLGSFLQGSFVWHLFKLLRNHEKEI